MIYDSMYCKKIEILVLKMLYTHIQSNNLIIQQLIITLYTNTYKSTIYNATKNGK
jgi:hypothetical protein